MKWLRSRESWEKEENERLAPYAVRSAESLGRNHPEPEHRYRTVFQRDRDRIVHSRAFRRLEYKTQVFVYHEGDHYRNRLTHTLENAQIARTLARALCLNEDLAEAVALSHDMGHTPFAHAGERVLDDLMAEHGGFDHNRQSLRVVDLLEECYPDFPGLNLSSETREGILKHGCSWDHPVPIPELGEQGSIEAQVANLADEIAYMNHDLDDGLGSGILEPEELHTLRLWREASEGVKERFGPLTSHLEHRQIIIALINRLVTDVAEASAERLCERAPANVDEVRSCDLILLDYSEPIRAAKQELKDHLRENFYFHPRVKDATGRAERVLTDLFRLHREDPSLLPQRMRDRFEQDGEPRVVADYIAGMTDRYALASHERLVGSGQPGVEGG